MSRYLETVDDVLPDGWSYGHVTIVLGDGERTALEAWRRGAFAVHQVRNPAGAILTHAPSGRRIAEFPTMDMATRCAESIDGFADWFDSELHEKVDPDLYAKVRAVILRIKGES